ncbi:MAG: serine acetyltransferase [Deltaproteobacteria bacterium]|nr:serine acetyltransferase [Deltaproteobacteria bacterium]
MGVRQRKTEQEFLDDLCAEIEEQVVRGLCAVCSAQKGIVECKKEAECKAIAFIEQLPKVHTLLQTDIQAAYNGDPAAINIDEIISCYPGFHAILSYRLAHELYALGVPLIPRMMTERAHAETGIDIHPGATIGESFFIDHGTGVVIGETCRIGKHVTIYQGVTLGAKSFPLDEHGNPVKGVDRHPVVEDRVIIYSDATILGRITLGEGSVIGGNVWLTKSVPPGSFITQATARSERYVDGGGI